MTFSPPSILSGDDPQNNDSRTREPEGEAENAVAPAGLSPRTPGPVGVVAVLRQALAEGSQSPDAMIRAAAESARALTGADGIAIALRAKGAILCRARSGDLAPELGSQLNAHSGFSGECLRTASILLCDDTMNDDRVDPEVCRMMGIRSIVAVPLRGSVGIAGILEAFSGRPSAFAHEQINSLRELASIAETAYETERISQEEETMASMRSPRRLPGFFARTATAGRAPEVAPSETGPDMSRFEAASSDSSQLRRYWVMGVSTIALLAGLGVWLSWRTPITELPSTRAATLSEKPVEPLPKPSPSLESAKVAVQRVDGGRGGAGSVVKKAAAIEADLGASTDPTRGAITIVTPTEIDPAPGNENSAPVQNTAGTEAATAPSPSETATGEPPPSVTIAEEDHSPLAALTPDAAPLPTMDAEVSRGVTQGQLIHKVDPIYPLPARAQRISGAVELEITIAQNGTVRALKSLSGDPLLVTAATNAVRRWRYRPVLLNGKPVEVEKKVTVLFRLP